MILGEVHDNPAHHVFQAEAIDALSPAAVVFEMFGPDGVAALRGVDLDDAEAVSAALDWDKSGWPDFSIYAPVFAAVGVAAIYGGAVPRDDVRRAIGEGAAVVLGEDAAMLGLDRRLDDDELSLRKDGQMEAHCDALPVEMLGGMVEAQRLRDAGLARAILDALQETGGPVAVITGNGHARTDWGIPVYLRVARPELEVVSIGQLEAQPEDIPPFDHWRITAPAAREDPCAAFR